MAIAATVSLIYTMIYSTLAYLVPGYQTFKVNDCYWRASELVTTS